MLGIVTRIGLTSGLLTLVLTVITNAIGTSIKRAAWWMEALAFVWLVGCITTVVCVFISIWII